MAKNKASSAVTLGFEATPWVAADKYRNTSYFTIMIIWSNS